MANKWTGKGNPYTKQEVRDRLKNTLNQNMAIIAAGAGTVITIVPFGVVQVGCMVTLAVGAAGVTGCALIVTVNTGEVHPDCVTVKL